VPNLHTTYMGLQLKNPVVPSASPLSRDLDGIKALEKAGAGAIVLYSLFQEQIALETGETREGEDRAALTIGDAMVHFPLRQHYPRSPEQYVEHLRRAKDCVDIPIIASMNGTSKGGWLEYAHHLEQAGADALELNIYYIPTTAILTGEDVETIYADIVRTVRASITIPLAVKLSPFFSALPNVAARLEQAGANALVLFNRFYQPDIQVASQELRPVLSLSRSDDVLLPLRWISILHRQVGMSLALTGGVHTPDDVLKALLAGADVAQVCSLLLQHGTGALQGLLDGLARRMDELALDSVAALRGKLSLQAQVDPAAFERASYVRMLQSFGGT
jgi:dihydroorotate dehydrogenase (fumarate)